MAQGYQANVPQRLTDADGLPAVGWKLTTYVAGTTTPLTTYSNATLTSMNTNPIVTDADGFFRCFVAKGILLKFSVTDDADVPQPDYSIDNTEPMVDDSSTPSTVTAVPTGGIVAYGALSAPTGFLLCDGSIVSRATYDDLFDVIGTSYGAGNGTTTFGLPDLRGRFPLGLATSGTGSTLGGTGGAIDHTHTGPSHTHAVTVARDGWGEILNAPAIDGRLNTGVSIGPFNQSYQATADLTVTSAAGGTGATGTGNPAFQAVVYIIKT